MCQVLSRDDGAPLGCVLRPPNGGEATYAYTITGALRRLGRARATTQPGVRSSARSAPRRARRGRRTPGVGPLFDYDTPRVVGQCSTPNKRAFSHRNVHSSFRMRRGQGKRSYSPVIVTTSVFGILPLSIALLRT